MVFELEFFKLVLLVMVRFSGLIVSAPILGSANFPIAGKVGLSFFSALLVTPALAQQPETLPSGMLAFAVLGLGELAIGLTIGFMLTIIFAAIQIAGQIMDMLTGFALINVFNPALETQVPIFGFFYFLIAALYLLVTGGHRLMLLGLSESFKAVPLGGFILEPALLRDIATLGGSMFYYGLIIAAPVAAAMFLAYVTLGLLSRVVPQIQLFVVGFPITIAAGLFMVAAVMSVYVNVLDSVFDKTFVDMAKMIRSMG